MNKKTLETEFNKLHGSSFAEDKFKQFLQKWWQTILYAIGGLILASVLLYQFTRGSEAYTIQDYQNAERLFTEFSASTSENFEEKFNALKTLMGKYPDLKQRYEGRVAQILLSKNKPSLAIPFAQASMSNAKKIGKAPYQEYSETSLLISQGNLREALSKAQSLQVNLSKEDTLYAFNLMRIATLESELGNPKAAKGHYQELLTLGKSNPLFENWLSRYKEGDLTYKQFIENFLSQKS